ncbi:hypothetical protein GALMADRAFT_1327590 [Galerina marginata CBS 339.88]|uniref:Hemerythrin-like domain-containing protein n=1 Tax=Galerina marginata (strain CBS 339.88) TaxID=685588 RepID=A0A067T1V5_GALM3|nr:hypothetical protein GALMADRAFT_1327590 [Galerina marginata CBS 339.88]
MSSISSEHYALIPLPTNPVLTSLEEDPQALFATDMALIHNVFIRGLNSMWRNAPLVKPGDEYGFAGYCLACIDAIHGHHHGEELFIFPFLQTKLNMAHNLEQHEAFHASMDAFQDYMKKVQLKKEPYDGAKARELVEAFANDLSQHLHDEIDTISPECMKAFDDDKEGMDKMLKALEQHIKAQPGKLTVFPFVVTHHNPKEAPRWPPAPAAIKWFARNIAPWRHPSYWKFSPFTTSGVPQTYESA